MGRVMATNPVPLVVPCHRILGSAGALGGYSAPGGLTLKQRLLDLEQSSGGKTPAEPAELVAV
ncbi:MAG: MGMT family protein [Planctomycetales bacterium]|nr:MGMT family protein [Planctomycetales bacterium]